MKIKLVHKPNIKKGDINYWEFLEEGKIYDVISDYEKDKIGHFFLISSYGKFYEIPVDDNIVKIQLI